MKNKQTLFVWIHLPSCRLVVDDCDKNNDFFVEWEYLSEL